MHVPAGLIAACRCPCAKTDSAPRVYGFRTSQALASREVWCRVNRVAGFAPLVAAGLAICIYLAKPARASGRSFIGVLALILRRRRRIASSAAENLSRSHALLFGRVVYELMETAWRCRRGLEC
jgi:hypothetical protein